MQRITKYRRATAIWLSAILIMLSVAASAHSVSHIDEGANSHCILCFHQHQLNKVLPQQTFALHIITQHYENIRIELQQTLVSHTSVYNSRASPYSL